jgi:hypothetical protein
MFAPNVLHTLAENYASLRARNDALTESYAVFQYKTQHGQEYATHGYLRRFYTMTRCVERVFALLPPEQDALPEGDTLIDATICIQAFVMNVFGALDNLARLWVSEKPLKVDQMKIGLGPKCKAVRKSFSPEMQDYLSKLQPWFAHIVDFRDALAHRIPLFVPPYCVPDANDAAYVALDARKRATRDADEYERIKAEQLGLVVFQPVIKHTLQDEKPPVVFHFQLLQDFGTVEEIGQKMLGELERAIKP